MILLDTDIVVDLLRKLPQAVKWFEDHANEQFVLPGYVAMELVQGCRSKAELNMLESHIAHMVIAWPTPEVCDAALTNYAHSRFEQGIGLLDALVGGLAVSVGLPLYTFNRKHYSGIPNLKTEQPYER